MSLGFALIGLVGLAVIVGSVAIGDHGDHGDADHGLNILSVRGISIMLTMFGVAGFLAAWYGLSPVPSAGIGTAAAVLAGVLYTAGMRALAGQQASSTITDGDIVGLKALVTTSIPADGIGEVQCHVRGRALTLMARSSAGPIASGTAVQVLDKVGGTVSVKPAA